MTPEQERAVASAYLMLDQVFDHTVIIVSGMEKKGALQQEDFHVCWSGGVRVARTLLHEAEDRMKYQKSSMRPPNVSKAVMDAVMRKVAGNHKDKG